MTTATMALTELAEKGPQQQLLKDKRMVFEMAFTAEEIDYLDNRADGEARRATEGDTTPPPAGGSSRASATGCRGNRIFPAN